MRRWGWSMALALSLGTAAPVGAQDTPAPCDHSVTAVTLSGTGLKTMPDLLCAWNGPYNESVTWLRDHGCFDNYACSLQSRSYAFSELSTETDGQLRYCSDCQPVNPCTDGGSGAFARGEGGAWNCSAGGGGGINHTLTWYFPGTPTAGVQPQRQLVPTSASNCTSLNTEMSVNTTASTSTTYNIQRCSTGFGSCASTTNIFTVDTTLPSSTQYNFNNPATTTIHASDAFRVNLVTVGTGLADVTVALTYQCDN